MTLITVLDWFWSNSSFYHRFGSRYLVDLLSNSIRLVHHSIKFNQASLMIRKRSTQNRFLSQLTFKHYFAMWSMSVHLMKTEPLSDGAYSLLSSSYTIILTIPMLKIQWGNSSDIWKYRRTCSTTEKQRKYNFWTLVIANH